MTKQPICLPCFRIMISMTEDPPREPGWPVEKCPECGRMTNNGIYVDTHLTSNKMYLRVNV